ncbi:MAG: hypothetical protein H2212_03600 [Ruminococcus sp.]|nr:hypothetical protein [Ruminococcus sp.]
MEKLIEVLRKFKVIEFQESNDLYKIKTMIGDLLNESGEQLERKHPYILTYHDLKMYDVLLKYMSAYDITFIQDKGIPYLKEHNPATISFLNVVVLFYSLIICELLIDKVIIIDDSLINDFNNDILNNISIFDYGWSVLDETMRLKDKDERTIYPYGHELYIRDEYYRLIEKTIRRHFDDSCYEKILGCVLGNYRMRFSYVMYTQKYQSMFIHLANDYKNNIK